MKQPLDAMEPVITAAIDWWGSLAPPDMPIAEHFKNPTIGATTIQEKAMAEAVAEFSAYCLRVHYGEVARECAKEAGK
mgnify:CR=1 FL=1